MERIELLSMENILFSSTDSAVYPVVAARSGQRVVEEALVALAGRRRTGLRQSAGPRRRPQPPDGRAAPAARAHLPARSQSRPHHLPTRAGLPRALPQKGSLSLAKIWLG